MTATEARRTARPSRYRDAEAALAQAPEAPLQPGRRWGVYVRISEDAAGEGLGIARQEVDCRQLAAEKGGDVVDIFKDNDVSAWSGRRRPGYQAMLQAIRDGRINGVVVYNLDRLTRRPIELEEFMELAERYQLQLANVTGEIDLSNHYGQMMARVRGAVARAASDDASMRIKRKMRELREGGRTIGGGRFYGWRGWDCGGRLCKSDVCSKFHAPMTVDPVEADVIRECCDRVLAGESLNAIHRDLIRRGIKTRKGNDWDRKSLRSMLVRARNAGWVEAYDKATQRMELVEKATDWEPIVTEEVWRSVRTILEDSDRKRHYTSSRVTNLLSHIATCSECGDWMIAGKASSTYTLADGTKKKHEAKIYKCKQSPQVQPQDGTRLRHPSRRKDAIDTFVMEAVLARLATASADDLLRVHLDDQQAGIEEELRKVEAQMDEHALMLAEGELTRTQFKIANERLMQRRTQLMDLREPVRNEQVLRDFLGDDPVREVWFDPDFGIDRQRAVIRALTKSIVIRPARRGSAFDEDSVVIEWA